MSAKRILPTELADENTVQSRYGGLEGHYSHWSNQLISRLLSNQTTSDQNGTCECSSSSPSDQCCQSIANSNDQDDQAISSIEAEPRIESDDDDDGGGCKSQDADIMDLEDMGDYIESTSTTTSNNVKKGPAKEMVTPLIRKSLEKQGYKIIGTHSGVKLCRWTKVSSFIDK